LSTIDAHLQAEDSPQFEVLVLQQNELLKQCLQDIYWASYDFTLAEFPDRPLLKP